VGGDSLGVPPGTFDRHGGVIGFGGNPSKTRVVMVELTPMINAVEVGAAPQMTDPTSKTNRATRKTHFGLKTL